MLSKSPHIVRKVSAEVTVPKIFEPKLDHASIMVAIQKAIYELEEDFDLQFQDAHYRIDRLEVELDLDRSDLEQHERRLIPALKKQIRKSLGQQMGQFKNNLTRKDFLANKTGDFFLVKEKEELKKLTSATRKKELLLFFLKEGYFPWWAGEDSLDGLETFLQELESSKWKTLKKELQDLPVSSVNRLAKQLSDKTLEVLLKKSLDAKQVYKLTQLIEELMVIGEGSPKNSWRSEKYRTVFEKMMLGTPDEDLTNELTTEFIDRERPSPAFLEQLKQALVKKSILNPEQWTEIRKKTGEIKEISPLKLPEPKKERFFKELDKEGLPVTYVGLVLLHPFLYFLFKELNYLSNKDFKDEASRERAVCLLYYLATGKEEFQEPDLVFSKFLVGWPLKSPIDRFSRLSSNEKQEAQTLLKSAIQHWIVLKNTSVKGLQERFLQRKGILKKEEFGDVLYVERESIDVLIDRLPWGLAVVQLPWLDSLLSVNW